MTVYEIEPSGISWTNLKLLPKPKTITSDVDVTGQPAQMLLATIPSVSIPYGQIRGERNDSGKGAGRWRHGHGETSGAAGTDGGSGAGSNGARPLLLAAFAVPVTERDAMHGSNAVVVCLDALQAAHQQVETADFRQ